MPKNATAKDIAKHQSDRAFYDLSGGENHLKYIATESKRAGKFTALDYFRKSTGIFNKNGMISQEELEQMKWRAQTGEKNLWHGFISVDEENSHKIDGPEKCIHLIKRTFDSFFRDIGFDPKNIDLICALHLDRPKHLHIHFEFWEKEPKQKYRKRETEYRHKGKIPQSVIDKMHERLNLFLTDEHIYHSRDEALRQLKELSVTHGFERFCEKEARREIAELAKDLPVGAKIFYGHKDMEPFRPRIDKIINLLLQTSKPARKADLKFHEDLEDLKQKVQADNVLEDIKADYIRRQGNIVLNAVRTIRAYTPRRTTRGKVNDKNLKRRAGIRTRVFGRTMSKLFSSFGEQCELLERDFSHRLQDIEKEIEEQRLQEQTAESAKTNSKWNWGK